MSYKCSEKMRNVPASDMEQHNSLEDRALTYTYSSLELCNGNTRCNDHHHPHPTCTLIVLCRVLLDDVSLE